MLTKKGFEKLALVLAEERRVIPSRHSSALVQYIALQELDYLEEKLMREFEVENPRFDRNKFRAMSRAA